ncbi:MAG: dihydrolipoyllysine-residue acetyltransferase [Brachymonas sp.]|nr:dihydrolipoyllysine-residue acetyltransferase [Brachymonas sp.]
MANIEVRVPDIGDFADVAVIELLVKPGDAVKAEQSLVTVESDKASMEIPSSHAGVVHAIKVALGDKIRQGDVLAVLEVDAVAASSPDVQKGQAPAPEPSPQPSPASGRGSQAATAAAPSSVADANAISSPEAQTRQDSTPSPLAGEGGGEGEKTPATKESTAVAPSPAGAGEGGGEGKSASTATDAAPPHQPNATAPTNLPHASPSVRKLARELAVPLEAVTGTGPKGRITDEDVLAFTRAVMRGERHTLAQQQSTNASAASADGNMALHLLPWPQIDFAQFGPTSSEPLSRIRKLSAANLSRNWAMIPHVTYCEDADVTELEALRVQLNGEKAQQQAGIKITLLAFIVKACVQALKTFPDFNASLDGDALVHKQYYHIGFAADTPNGLVVPVIKNADQKGVLDISRDLAELSQKAREGKLTPSEMRGASFTISSLGGIGGTYFSPIINAPEVAILGVGRNAMRPRWNGSAFEPRLMLPLALSADHRVIDGASAARFNAYLAQMLADFRRALL